MREADVPVTAFTTHDGLFEYTRMPFGLKNAPATFQRVLDMILSGHNWKSCLVYIDDVVIFSSSAEQHIRDVDEILQLLGRANVSLKFKKCRFFTDSIRYLGHIVRPGTLEVDHSHVKSLLEAKPPRTVSELRSFLGFVNVYRRFVPRFTELAKPLYGLLKGGPKELQPLTKEHIESFEALVRAVTSPPILALPQPGLRFSLDTDASDYQVGCALFQTHSDGSRKPIGFWSRKLNDAEQNYSATEKECLAVVYGITTCRPYLLYEDFDLHTDHACLRWLLEINDPSGRLMRWRLRLAEYTFLIHHKKGYLNTQADALSRLRSSGHTTEHADFEVPVLLTRSSRAEPPVQITFEELIREQSADAFCENIRSRLERGEAMMFEDNPSTGVLERILPTHRVSVIPASLQPRLLSSEHYPVCAGHNGERRMYQSLRRQYYWPRMILDCVDTVARCEQCAKSRTTLQDQSSKMKLFPPDGPLEDVAMDLLGPLLQTPRGNKHLLVIVDRFSKLVRTVPMSSTRAFDLAKAFTREWVFIYGPPKTVLTDNGSNFTSKFMLEVHRSLGIEPKMTTTYHPQTNGQAERYNRTLLAALRKYVVDHPRDWDLFTDALTFGYNSHVHTSTGFAPFELVLSRAPALQGLEDMRENKAASPREARFEWLQRLKSSVAAARKRLHSAQQRAKKNFDDRLRKREKDLRAGDRAYLRRPKGEGPVEERHKLADRSDGPYEIVRSRENTAVIKRGKMLEEVNKSRLEKSGESSSRAKGKPIKATDKKPRTGEREGVEGYVIEKITNHCVDPENGKMEFRVKWLGFEEQTWEPVAHLHHSQIVRYCDRVRIFPPANLGEARIG